MHLESVLQLWSLESRITLETFSLTEKRVTREPNHYSERVLLSYKACLLRADYGQEYVADERGGKFDRPCLCTRGCTNWMAAC